MKQPSVTRQWRCGWKLTRSPKVWMETTTPGTPSADFELWTRFARYADLNGVSTILGGFTDRRKQNRSIANRDKYNDDVRRVAAELRANASSPEAKLAKKLAFYMALRRKSRLINVAGVVKRILSLRDLRAPVLRW